MRASFFNCFLIVGSIILISASTQLSSLEDEEGSGSDLESDGSGDETPEDSVSYKLNITNNTSVVTDAAIRHRYPSHASYTFDPNISPWGETEPELVMLYRDEEHFWQNKDFLYAVITGAVTGTIIAVVITAFFIHKWHNEEEKEEYKRREEERQRPRIATTVL